MKKLLSLISLLLIQQIAMAQLPKLSPNLSERLAQQKSEYLQKIVQAEQLKTENQDHYDVGYYSLDLNVDPVNRELSGSVQVVAEVIADTFRQVDLNFWDGMNVSNIFWTNNENKNLQYNHEQDILTVKLDSTLKLGEHFQITIIYSGKPQFSPYGGFGFHSHAGKPMIWTLSQPFGARSWWPCKDLTSDKADSVDIRVTVPNELIVASNGSLRETSTEGDLTTFWWHEQYPIVSYLISLAIHPYKVYYDDYIYNNGLDTMQIHFYMFHSNYEEIKPLNALTKDMIAFFASCYGEYPFVKEKYGHAEFVAGGAMEHQTCTSFGFWNEPVIAHELAHQWGGDLITCDTWNHIWLNEGFATYSEALWIEHVHPEFPASDYQLQANLYLGPGTIYVEDPEHEVILHGGLSYNKGSWVFHMLRHIVGDTTFFKILKTYFASPLHSYGTATTEEFQAIAEQLSGKNLERFFHQWIYEEWFPHYSYLWQSTDLGNGNFKVSGLVNQIQTEGPLFEMPVDMTIRTAAGDTTFVLLSDEQSEYFECTVKSRPNTVLLDKDNWILKQVSVIDKPMLLLKNFQLDDSAGNGNGYAEPGETIKLISEVENQGLPAKNLTFVLKTEDADITFSNDTFQLDTLDLQETVNNQANPFTFSVANSAVTHLGRFWLCFSTPGGYRDSVAINFSIGMPDILVVDDDAGMHYEDFIIPGISENNLAYDVWDVSQNQLTAINEQYRTLIWFTGKDCDSTLTPTEQIVLANFLDAGGNLILTGQNIGFDLIEAGSVADSLFYTNYLHAEYVQDHADDPWIMGIPGNLISSRLFFYLDGNYPSANNQISTDMIAPIEPAQSFLNYLTAKGSAGIYYFNETTGAKVAYLPFGVEGISGPNPNSLAVLFERIITWLTGTTGGIQLESNAKIPTAYQLFPNFPNPFNPSTKIRFDLPEKSITILKIYNLLGQEVRTLVNEIKKAGSYEIIWNGLDNFGKKPSSGIYLYRLETDGFKQTNKMLLVN